MTPAASRPGLIHPPTDGQRRANTAGIAAFASQLKPGPAGADSVLIAVDPQRRNVDIVTGPAARARLADRGCKLAVMSMVASFKEGDLLGGLLSGLRMLSDQAGIPHHGH